MRASLLALPKRAKVQGRSHLLGASRREFMAPPADSSAQSPADSAGEASVCLPVAAPPGAGSRGGSGR